MTQDPASALREQARDWGRGLLATAPWQPLAPRLTLLLTNPPSGIDLPAEPPTPAFWLLLDTPEAREAPPPYREPLLRDGVAFERTHSREGATEVLATTLEAAARILEGAGRRSLELRWAARHAEPLQDRMGRADQLAGAARRLPEGASERVVRGLWLQAAEAVRALWLAGAAPASMTLGAAGEAATALGRLACFLEEGAHPPLEWLAPAARDTTIGRRIASWTDDLGAAVGGDEAATRRVLAAREQVLREVEHVLGDQYRGRPWLHAPEAYAFRIAR